MAKLKVAILEDNAHLLKELKTNLEDTGLVEVIAYARDSEDFLDKINHTDIPEKIIKIE